MPDYEHVAIADVPNMIAPADQRKDVDEAVGATAMGVNFFVARPGQIIPFGYHSHPDQEELFYVVAGELAFDTPDGEFHVGADEVFFAPANAPHRGRVVGDEPARVLAIGAPGDAGQAEIREPCPSCEEPTGRDFSIDDSGAERELVLYCEDCGTETARYTRGPDDS